MLAPLYCSNGRPSVDPELMIRMLIVGYCFAIRSERRLCEEAHLNLAYRWFCGLGLEGKVPDHSTFSRNRHGRFRQSDILRRLFETVVQRCIAEVLVGWSMRPWMTTDLVLQALLMAVWRRKPKRSVTIHSDQGSQSPARIGKRSCNSTIWRPA